LCLPFHHTGNRCFTSTYDFAETNNLTVCHFLCHFNGMKANATEGKAENGTVHRRAGYRKALDARNHPIRGLWRRGEKFYARMSVEDPSTGVKTVQRIPLKAGSVADAVLEMKRLSVSREDGGDVYTGQAPKLQDYFEQDYMLKLESSGKRPATIEKERGSLKTWCSVLGQVRLNLLRAFHITRRIAAMRREGLAPRTVNLHIIALRNLLESARLDGHITRSPAEGIPWLRSDTKARSLLTAQDVDRLCAAALTASKNGPQLADYIRFLATSGARMTEALALRWQDVNLDKRQVTIGAEGHTKNRTPRVLDMNPTLEAHLRDMAGRRQPDCDWIFPSPQRGERDVHALTFWESMKLARKAAGLPSVGFHDLRHHFISYAVMSGVDFMTIAKWVGHRDGGVLIGKVYGHLSDEHKAAQAQLIRFGPTASTADVQEKANA